MYPVNHIAVVLFAYDEKGNLLRLLQRIQAALSCCVPTARIHYAVCVQGTDGTYEEALQFAAAVQDAAAVSLCHAERALGIRGACVKAFDLLPSDVVPDAYLMMDCDLNHQPEELPGFFGKLEENTVVIGSRFCTGGRIVGMPLWKRFLSIGFNRCTSLLFRVSARDKTSGYRLIAGRNIAAIAREVIGTGFDFYIEFLLRMNACGISNVEVPIQFTARTKGVSKMRIGRTLIDYLRLMRRISTVVRMAHRSNKP